MTGFRVGLIDGIVASRPAADTFTRANYLAAVANRVDSFWVPDHLNPQEAVISSGRLRPKSIGSLCNYSISRFRARGRSRRS